MVNCFRHGSMLEAMLLMQLVVIVRWLQMATRTLAWASITGVILMMFLRAWKIGLVSIGTISLFSLAPIIPHDKAESS